MIVLSWNYIVSYVMIKANTELLLSELIKNYCDKLDQLVYDI